MEPETATMRRTGRGYGRPADAGRLGVGAPARGEPSHDSSRAAEFRFCGILVSNGWRGSCDRDSRRQAAAFGDLPRRRRGSERRESASAESRSRTKENAPSRSRLRPAHPIDLRRSDCRAGGPSSFGAPCSVQSETYPGISSPSSVMERLRSQIATISISVDYSSNYSGPTTVSNRNSTQKYTEVGAPSSDLPTDHRRSDCLSESHQPRALLPRCTRDTRGSPRRRQVQSKHKYRSLRFFLYNLHILA